MRTALALLLAAVTACAPDQEGRDAEPADHAPSTSTRVGILTLADRRPTGEQLDELISATRLPDPSLRATATEGLGRLERPFLVDTLAPLLSDEDAAVRAATARALAQAVQGRDGTVALQPLLDRAAVEGDPNVRGALAHALGRVDVDATGRWAAQQAMVRLGGDPSQAEVDVLLDVALGFEDLSRGAPESGLSLEAAEYLLALSAYGLDTTVADSTSSARVRALALTVLGRARRLSAEQVADAFRDPEAEVRRVAVGFLGVVPAGRRTELVRAALTDASPRVAVEAVRRLDAGSRTLESCEYLTAAAAATVAAPVRLAALEALARPCPTREPQFRTLAGAARLPEPVGSASVSVGLPPPWQPASRALLSLTTIDFTAASEILPSHVAYSSPFVRSWAARTATALRDEETLRTLATDSAANVRTAALRGLVTLVEHEANELLLAHLDSDDPQLLLTAARLLEGSPTGVDAATRLLDALERISRERRESLRDARLALLDRLEELGNATLESRLAPFLSDYDPLVAARAAEVLTTWTGERLTPTPEPPDPLPFPTNAQLEALESTAVALHMAGGGTITIELLPDVAPTNAFRFVRLAGDEYYDGLTFHRVVPNFVAQGGSPGANEYAGDGPFTRDEVGHPHWRGTVGLSTRGRDTGDAQLFINLVDNVRLDHEYTVFGVVTSGMAVVDRLLEGAVIERAQVMEAR